MLKDERPEFSEIQRRSLMTNRFKIDLAAKRFPATFLAFDVLYLDDQATMEMPLQRRKELLRAQVTDGDRMAVSRLVGGGAGQQLYALAEQQDLEGVVAKRLDSIYTPGKRTKDWIKIKNLQDDDFVVCGWIPKDNHMTSIVLGQYLGNILVYKGHVTLGVGGKAFETIKAQGTLDGPPLEVPAGHGNESAYWIAPRLVCTVKYMEKTKAGGMRQPVFKGLRPDKNPKECTTE